jgi:hypothetical protein
MTLSECRMKYMWSEQTAVSPFHFSFEFIRLTASTFSLRYTDFTCTPGNGRALRGCSSEKYIVRKANNCSAHHNEKEDPNECISLKQREACAQKSAQHIASSHG